MPASSPSFFFKNVLEYQSRSIVDTTPRNMRGLYILYKEVPASRNKSGMDVLYVGMAHGPKHGVRMRLRSHDRRKEDWTHFSVYEVWDNITESLLRELEGMFLHIYRRDPYAGTINKQKNYGPLMEITQPLSFWQNEAS